MTRVTIYDVDGLVQSYAKETSTDFKALQRRYKRITSGKRFAAAFPRYHGGWGVAFAFGVVSMGLPSQMLQPPLYHTPI